MSHKTVGGVPLPPARAIIKFMNAASILASLIALLSVGHPIAIHQQAETLRDVVECSARRGLPNVFAKWRAGKEVRIAYFGGSITSQNGWRQKTMAWFTETHPNAKPFEINAAIPGTGSELGVYRLRQDVLDHSPDLVFVEYAINDGGQPTDRITKGMEGIVRQIWKANASTDICFVYSASEPMFGNLEAGKFPHSATVMEQVADHYGIPSIHMGLEAAHLHQAGKLILVGKLPTTDAEKAALNGKIVFSADGVHPYESTGQELYFEAIKRNFPKIEQASTEPGPHALPAPILADNWEQAKLIPWNGVSLSKDWQKLEPSMDAKVKEYTVYLPGLWKANHPGASVTIRFKGTALYVYDLIGPDCCQINVQFDNYPPYLAPRFDEFCLYHRLSVLPIADNVPNTVHTVVLTISPNQPDKLAILHQRPENAGITTLDPKLYNDTAWYAGAVLVLGDLVPSASDGKELLKAPLH